MSQTEIILRLALIALLGGYLLRQRTRRVREWELNGHARPEPVDWEGTAFDVQAFRQAMEESPVDVVGSAKMRGRQDFRHDERIDAARSRMLGLGWFRHRFPGEDPEARAA